MKILVLGAGRMGFGAAFDLAHNSEEVREITVADVDEARAREIAARISEASDSNKSSSSKAAKIDYRCVDVRDEKEIVELMRPHDAVISCVTYHYNLSLAQAAIEAGTNFCDLGGNNDVVASELALNAAAQRAGINIIPDCGLAPGMVSVLVAHGAARFERLDEVHIRVGGLPQNPRPPLDYQIVFSVEGLINEYIERARVIRGGEITEVESLTEIETLRFPEPFGELEAFQTSGGTSTLPETFKGQLRELDYKTIRYPGHCERFKLLIDLGLASSAGVEIDGAVVVPRRVLGEMLTRSLPADEPDAVLVRVEFHGEVATTEGSLAKQLVDVGQISEEEAKTEMFRKVISQAVNERQVHKRQTLRYDIIDLFDERTGLSAMMRTTAFPASIIAQMMARGRITGKGAIPQERCVPPEEFVKELAARDIAINESWIE
jgi:lysine 6-dehydrogenase